jgi:hypothetical protein
VYGKTIDEIVPAMQLQLCDIMPQIRIAGTGPLIESVNDIVIHLSSEMLTTLKKKFPHEGLECDEFVEVLMVALCGENPKLQTREQAIILVALLHDLFTQMDVDGEGNRRRSEEVGVVGELKSGPNLFMCCVEPVYRSVFFRLRRLGRVHIILCRGRDAFQQQRIWWKAKLLRACLRLSL